MINKYIAKIVFALVPFYLFSANVFCSAISSSGTDVGIPFKTEHSAIDNAASTFPYVLLLLILFIAVLYFLNKKYGFINSFASENNNSDSFKVLHMKRITTNTIFFQIKVDGKEYMFLESKNTLREVKQD